MALTCPRCLRKLSDSVDPVEPPVFCMYCGQKLRATADCPALPPVMPDQAETIDAPEPIYDVSVQVEQAPPPRAADGQVAAVGSVIGGYRLGRVLGSGGMGAVYEAENETTGQRVAIKLLSSRLSANPTSVERFRQEGRVASQITHPRCVFVLRADADAGRPYIVMELMPGRTLKDLVDDRGPLPPGEAVARILDVIDGLAEAHRCGVIHRDVKPSNCFLTDDDRVKVGDFGLSKSLDPDQADQHLTQSGHFLGTILYASPEQIRGEPVGYESDVYSVCATLYHLLAGRAPFQHESLTAALARAVSEPPPPFRAARPDVSPELERVVLKGLDRDRARRWESLEELREELIGLQPERQAPARPRDMVLAFLIDLVLIQVVILPAEVVVRFLVGTTFGLASPTEWNWPAELVYFVYFAVADGLFGCTVGKRLARLRVVRVGRTGPPGLRAGAVRAGVFALLTNALMVGPEWLVEVWPRGPAGWVLALLGAAVAVAALLLQFRRTAQGWRGVHDFASGCRVVQRPRPAHRVRLASRFPNPLDRVQPSPVKLPEVVGGFGVKGKICALPDGGEVWAGVDKALGRRVLVRVFPPGRDDPVNWDAPVTRPTRLRAVGHGTVAWNGTERAWVGYVAPAGAPLADVIDPRGPLSWADARLILEQLVNELADAAGDGSGVYRPAVEQVWVEPGGRVQILDFPLPVGAARVPGALPEPGTGDPSDLVRRVATLALEGTPRAAGGRVRAPLPAHASRITDRLFGGGEPGALDALRGALADNHAFPPHVSAGVRAAHIGVQGPMLALGLVVMFVLGGVFNLTSALTAVLRAQSFADTARIIESDAGCETLLERARRHALNAAERERIESALRPTDRAATRRKLRQAVAVQQVELDEIRQHLNRPERTVLTRFQQESADDVTDADEISLRNVDFAVTTARAGKGATFAAARWPMFGVFVVGVVVWPLVWAGFALVFRGGLAMAVAGITIVRADGRPAGRVRCAARELLVWLPLTAVLLACLWAQAAAPELVLARTVLWLAAVLMVPLYVAIALREPARPPQDRIMGTYLVPV
ncbi:protein kinase domain-containing protein [Fimbriiglobus ruber]|uniref:Serine/threonine protein kinase n=1 Tax=Fimbriiglobus ruber TaxID=1908690 RepID=A0A225DW83_9BACT|nr:protein kinase [Fimbriiglobus ruber]OWK45642.1 serine/threonine protein kinase [Fimbriiglobus ruber]